jgi:hypothetical protein
MMYHSNCLEWHLDDERIKTPQGSVWSCRTASESFDPFNRLAVAHAKSRDHRASCGVFAFGADRTPHDSKHSNLGGVEEKRDTVCRKARVQLPNSPWGWSHRQAQGHTVQIRSMTIHASGVKPSLSTPVGVGGSLDEIFTYCLF